MSSSKKRWGGIVNGVPTCPSLTRSSDHLKFRDVRGVDHNLLNEERLTLKRTSAAIGKSYTYVKQAISRKEIYPVRIQNGRAVEVFACAVVDWKARQVLGRQVAA